MKRRLIDTILHPLIVAAAFSVVWFIGFGMHAEQPTQTRENPKGGNPITMLPLDDPQELTPINFSPYDNEAQALAARLVDLWDATTDDRSPATVYDGARSWKLYTQNATYVIYYGPTTEAAGNVQVPAFRLTVAKIEKE